MLKDIKQLKNLIYRGNYKKIIFFFDGRWKSVSNDYSINSYHKGNIPFKVIRSDYLSKLTKERVNEIVEELRTEIRWEELRETLFRGNYEKIIITLDDWKMFSDDYKNSGTNKRKKPITFIRRNDYPKLTREQSYQLFKTIGY